MKRIVISASVLALLLAGLPPFVNAQVEDPNLRVGLFEAKSGESSFRRLRKFALELCGSGATGSSYILAKTSHVRVRPHNAGR